MSRRRSRPPRLSKKLKEQIKRYAEAVVADIQDCGCQQPAPEGEIMWIRSQKTELDDLMAQHGVPDELLDDVASLIQCPACGEQLNRYSDVGIESLEESRHKQRIEEASRKYRRDLVDLAKHLQSGKRARGFHPAARALLREIGAFPKGQVVDRVWCRARRDNGVALSADDLRPPGPGISGPGRYNHRGESQWYLAENEEQAAAEVAREGDQYVWIQRFRVVRLDNVLDLRAWVADDGMATDDDPNYDDISQLAYAAIYGDHLTNKEESPEDDREPHYAVPRFISDVAKRRGYTSIRYQSPRHVGENLVIFDGSMRLEAVGTPQRVRLTPRFFRRRADRLIIEGFHVGFPEWPPELDDGPEVVPDDPGDTPGTQTEKPC